MVERSGLATAEGGVPSKAEKTVLTKEVMHFVYILKSIIKEKYYIGWTNGLIIITLEK